MNTEKKYSDAHLPVIYPPSLTPQQLPKLHNFEGLKSSPKCQLKLLVSEGEKEIAFERAPIGVIINSGKFNRLI